MDSVRTFLLFVCITHLFAISCEQIVRRESLEIIIGGGGTTPAPPPENQDCPPPPPPPCPPPPAPKHSPPPPPPPRHSPPPPPPKPPSPPPPQPQPPSPKPKPKPKPKPSPSPKPKPKPKPSPKPKSLDGFESERLKLVFPVIQKFKTKVINDPQGITKTWKGKNICRDYTGFVCDIVPGYNQKALAGVKFNNYNFNGPDLTLTEFLMGLPDIVFFHANSNNFTGAIPSQLNKLKYLYELDLSNNKFSGNFPYEVLRGTKLLFLDLRFNNFAGVVPPQVFLLNLDLLFINNNNFIQKLPDNLGRTTALFLTLANNKFIGGIPSSIRLANNTLQEVLFLNNKLSGCLPYEIGFLKKATVFDVGSNDLTGPIPHSFQCLKNMELLNLAHNMFFGVVPEAVCSIPRLQNFTLSYNYFTQVGPECRKLIKKGVLNVSMNCIFDLPNQRKPAECDHFFSKGHDPCVNAKSLTLVPCSIGYSGAHQLEALDGQLTTAAPVSAPTLAHAPGRGYGALSPH